MRSKALSTRGTCFSGTDAAHLRLRGSHRRRQHSRQGARHLHPRSARKRPPSAWSIAPGGGRSGSSPITVAPATCWPAAPIPGACWLRSWAVVTAIAGGTQRLPSIFPSGSGRRLTSTIVGAELSRHRASRCPRPCSAGWHRRLLFRRRAARLRAASTNRSTSRRPVEPAHPLYLREQQPAGLCPTAGKDCRDHVTDWAGGLRYSLAQRNDGQQRCRRRPLRRRQRGGPGAHEQPPSCWKTYRTRGHFRAGRPGPYVDAAESWRPGAGPIAPCRDRLTLPPTPPAAGPPTPADKVARHCCRPRFRRCLPFPDVMPKEKMTPRHLRLRPPAMTMPTLTL